jgi:hypothetical protein
MYVEETSCRGATDEYLLEHEYNSISLEFWRVFDNMPTWIKSMCSQSGAVKENIVNESHVNI